MFQTFVQDIKPLNDQLGVSLDMNTIEVHQVKSEEQEVRVKVSFINRHGNRSVLDNVHIRNCRAMGLMI